MSVPLTSTVQGPVIRLVDPVDLSGQISTPPRRPNFEGTYSNVYRCEYSGMQVAVKVIKIVCKKPNSMIRKIKREGKVWASLNHPNILPLYGFVQDEEYFGPYGAFISPWYPNGDAALYLEEHGESLLLIQRVVMWMGVTSGVAYLHSFPLVHGDIKPKNILIDNEGNPRLCDFGLVKICLEEGSSEFTTTSQHTGTERYMAPELFGVDNPTTTTLSDVWALGCVGHEFAFLKYPYHGVSRGMLPFEIKRGRPPAEHDEGLDTLLESIYKIFRRCWNQSPQDRPSTPAIVAEIRSVALCGSKCSSCGLLCLEHKQHDGSHDCQTDHKCPELCGFSDQHADDPVPACGMPAGHEGQHVCKGKPHLCSLQCQLHGRDGCLEFCSKPMSHDDEEHLCAARVHACGEPCGLVKSDGTPICTRRCVVDCNQDHSRHMCDRSLSCPVKCQLCNSFCAAGDHFHALEDDAIHLCGQTHACSSNCQMPGICEIATTPQSIESTFRGRHTTFQYTKYTQEARRLHCIVPIEAHRTEHDGPHVHSQDPNSFHFCEERCKHCGHYCTLPLSHNQNEHETSHGSMSHSEWVVEGDDDAAFELEGRKYATGDNTEPMRCSMLCKSLGRHVHTDVCRADDGEVCRGEGFEHFNRQNRNTKLDWITHRLFWARTGFKDPYTVAEQNEFDLCDYRCPGEEHDVNVNQNAVPSFCTLPLFHQPADPDDPPPLGHVSRDGHLYNCKSPALSQRSFHIFFALDRSGSMTSTDRVPLGGTPATQRIVRSANNRFGAVVSSLYGFWTAREAAIRSGTAAGARRDAYTIVTFDHNPTVTLSNDVTSDSDQLLDLVLGSANRYGGTNFTAAIETIQTQMEATWMTERSPVVIFLSDGECDISDSTVYDLCHSAVRLGKALSFHSVYFGSDRSQSLRRMAAIAGEVYDAAPHDPLAPPGNAPCSYHNALNTVQLATTFLGIAESLKNPREALSRI